MQNITVPNVIKTILMALTYYITGKISLNIFSQDMIVTMAAFAPEGFALAAALIYGRSILLGIFLGQLVLALDSGLLPLASLSISMINTFEAYLGIRLFQYFKLHRALMTTKDIFGLIGLIVFILQPISSILGNTVLLLLGHLENITFVKNLFFWWFGNVMGQLLFTPMLLVLYFNKQKIKIIEFILVFVFFLLIDFVLQVTLQVDNISILFMITLPTTLYLSTTNLSYASVASVLIATISLYLTHLGLGTFSHATSQIDNIINLNFFILSHIILVLIIGVLFREKQEAINSLESMAHYDFLTGLPNRHLLREEIHHTVYLAHEKKQKSAICFIDLDGFKKINDTLGHDIGDKVLKEVVKRVKIYTQSEDAFLRIGGDEFLIIFNNCTSKESIDKKLTLILESASKTMHIDGHQLHISFSIGVASCPQDGTTVEALMNASDNAMYEAKRRGKNQFIYA
jgi:diguanylate cyclase (GGDEF)-like protein